MLTKTIVIIAMLVALVLMVRYITAPPAPRAPPAPGAPPAPRAPPRAGTAQELAFVGAQAGAQLLDHCFSTVKGRARATTGGHTSGTCGGPRNSTYSYFTDKKSQSVPVAQLSTMTDPGSNCMPDLNAVPECRALFPA